MSDSEQCSNRLQLDLMLILDNFLAPPAERQRSFSNTDLSVVRLLRLRGGGAYLRNASVTFLLFWHEASFGCPKSHIER